MSARINTFENDHGANGNFEIVTAAIKSVETTYDFALKAKSIPIQLAFYPSNGNNDYFEGNNEKLTDSHQYGYLLELSKSRFDTVIVRNLLFVSNIQRLLRLMINRTINIRNDPLLVSSSIANSSATEYGHDPFTNLEQIHDSPMTSTIKFESNRLM
jgi:hypothetical protein